MADLSPTQRKVNEVEYFLDAMEERTKKKWPWSADARDWEEFGYNLSAFFNAADNLKRLLGADVKKPGEGIWGVLLAEERKLVDSMHLTQETHLIGSGFQRGTELAVTFTHHDMHPGERYERHHVIPLAAGGDSADLANVRLVTATEHRALHDAKSVLSPQFVGSSGPEPLLPKCRQYLELLREMVRAFEGSG